MDAGSFVDEELVDVLQSKLYLLSGCRNFGGHDETSETCMGCCEHDGGSLSERCKLFQIAFGSFMYRKREKAYETIRGWRKP